MDLPNAKVRLIVTECCLTTCSNPTTVRDVTVGKAGNHLLP